MQILITVVENGSTQTQTLCGTVLGMGEAEGEGSRALQAEDASELCIPRQTL